MITRPSTCPIYWKFKKPRDIMVVVEALLSHLIKIPGRLKYRNFNIFKLLVNSRLSRYSFQSLRRCLG